MPHTTACGWLCGPYAWLAPGKPRLRALTALLAPLLLSRVLQAMDAEFPDEPPRGAGGAAAGAGQYDDLEDDFELDDGDLFGEGEEGGAAAGAEEAEGGRSGSAAPPRKKAKHRAVMDEDEDEDE